MAYGSFGVDELWSPRAADGVDDARERHAAVRHAARRVPPRADARGAAGSDRPALAFVPAGADEVAIGRLLSRSGGAGGKVRYDVRRGWLNSAARIVGERHDIVP